MITLKGLLEVKKEIEHSMTITATIEWLEIQESIIDDFCKYHGITREQLNFSRLAYLKENEDD
jgi:hypothetical protein